MLFILRMEMYNLDRFLQAQENNYEQALAEIKNGKKISHWIWYVFPQLKGLGRSSLSEFYGIENIEEAVAYMNHPQLKLRYFEVCAALLALKPKPIKDIMGYPDDIKLHSSLTLFSKATNGNKIIQALLDKYFSGKDDQHTLQLLNV